MSPPDRNISASSKWSFSFGVVLAFAFWQLRSIRKAREKLRDKEAPPDS